MRLRRALTALALAAGIAAPLPAAAQDTGLKRLTLRQDFFGFEAVGRLDMEDGFCSAALIAPDLLLTAAHCLLDDRTGAQRDPREMTFRAAFADGVSLAERKGARAVMHPAYAASDADSLRQLTSDIALVQLAEPISAAIASPFATAAPPGPGSRVSVVSYAHDRADAPAWQRACQLMGRGQGAMMMSCDTDFGSSGAPVFDMSAGRPRIVSLISRGVREDGQALVYGMEIAEPLAETKAALRAGRGVWPQEAFSARRVTMGGAAPGGGSALGGGGALNRGSGAHFVRP